MSSRTRKPFHITSDVEIVAVGKWGNALAVRLPAETVDEHGIERGDDIGVRVAEDGCVEVVPGEV